MSRSLYSCSLLYSHWYLYQVMALMIFFFTIHKKLKEICDFKKVCCLQQSVCYPRPFPNFNSLSLVSVSGDGIWIQFVIWGVKGVFPRDFHVALVDVGSIPVLSPSLLSHFSVHIELYLPQHTELTHIL